MPRAEDEESRQPLLQQHDSMQETVQESMHELRNRAWTAWDSFTSFALRDNVLEVAVGLIFASSFTALANSLVTDIILPIISLLPFISRNLEERFTVLRSGPNHPDTGYNTKVQALDDGAIIWAWGTFLDKFLRFFLIALSLWSIAKCYGWLASDNIIKKQVKCKYCRKYISEKAKRCVNCTSWMDGREELKAPPQE